MKLAAARFEADRHQAAEPALQALRAAVELHRQKGMPLHLCLRAGLLDAFASNEWAQGDKLPAETAIARAVGLSLGTVQKVLAQLAREEILVRRHGRGTFVAGLGAQSDQLLHFRFVGDDGSTIVPVYAEALERNVVDNKAWAQFMPDVSKLIRIARRIAVGDEFDCISEFYIDARRFKPVLQMPFEDLHRVIIRNLLARQFNAPTLSITQRVTATEFPEHIRNVMKLPRNRNYGLLLEIFSYSHARLPVSVQHIFVPAGVRRLEIPSPRLVR